MGDFRSLNMAPLRTRSIGYTSKCNIPASSKWTRQSRSRPAKSIDEQHERYHNEEPHEPDFESDLNEVFIQCTVPNHIDDFSDLKKQLKSSYRKRSSSKVNQAPPTPGQSLERRTITPGIPIKVERISDSLPDVYDASPHGQAHKTTRLERRQTSRSTAQLTTPASSPDCICSSLRFTEKLPIVKSEIDQGGEGRHNTGESRSIPAPRSSPERVILLREPARERFPTTPQLSPSRVQRGEDTQDTRDEYNNLEEQLADTILPQKLNIKMNHGSRDVAVSNRQPHTSTSMTLAGENGQNGGQRSAYPPILPPPRTRSLISKTTTPPEHTRTESTPPPTPKGMLPGESSSLRKKTCCKLMCLRCTPKNLQEEYGLGPPEKRPNVRRYKSSRVYPSSLSSFGTDDDIPTSGKQLQEVLRTITESTDTCVSKHLSEISPSFKYSNVRTHPGHRPPSSSVIEDAIDIDDNLEVPIVRRKNPCRSIFKTSQVVLNKDERLATGASQCSRPFENEIRVEKEAHGQSPWRSLRSHSTCDNLSTKVRNRKDQGGQKDDEEDAGYESEDVTSSNDEYGQDEYLKFEYAGSNSRKLFARAPQRLNNTDQGLKRRREVVTEEHPTLFGDEDVGSGDDLVEIHGDVFKASENRRKKRHKAYVQNLHESSRLGSPAPKEEQSLEDRHILLERQDCETGDVSSKNNLEASDQDIPPCEYYMNTYWEHGRASDGRRARDGFTSYPDFKEYCKKNKQPIDDRCVLTYKKDLKHYLLCEHHASLRQDLFRAAWNFEHNPGFSFKSSNKDEETRRLQNEAIGNAPSPGSVSRGESATANTEMVDMIGEILKGIGTSYAADVAQLTKSKKKLESEVKGLKRRLARIQKR